jgi:hypothetical protein
LRNKEVVGVLAFKVPGHPIVHGGKERRRRSTSLGLDRLPLQARIKHKVPAIDASPTNDVTLGPV